jgi:uncharacterized NAD(P)/FAD-binding protein YdhS
MAARDQMAEPSVAVVGGGCAGVLAARELLRCTSGDVLLIEPGRPGGGLAYGEARPWHLLNSRAGAMSADPDDPGHFVRWANARGIPAAAEDFLSRRVWLIGSLRRGAEWETTAVPEIRAQARRLATDLAAADRRAAALPAAA